MSDRLLSLDAAADRIGVSERTLRRQLDDPRSGLRATRIGRRRLLSAADIDVWLGMQRERPAAALPTDILAAFSPAARELLDWAICARNAPKAPNCATVKG